MSSVIEASRLLRHVAEPYSAGDKAKAAIMRACERVSAELRAFGLDAMSYGRTKRIWKAEARRVDGFELDAIRRAAEARAKRAADLEALKREAAARDARNQELAGEINSEVREAIASFAAMREMLAAADKDMFGPEIDRLGNVIGRLRRRLALDAGEKG